MDFDLSAVLHKYCYKTGLFVLASGLTSNEYLDVRLATHHPVASLPLLTAMSKWFSDIPAAVRQVDAVAGVAVGGVILATMAVNNIRTRYKDSVYQLTVRLEPKSHGGKNLTPGSAVNSEQIDGYANLKDIKQPLVILMEDVITTGASTIKAIDILTAAGMEVGLVLAICDREQGGIERIRERCNGTVAALTTISKVRQIVS